MRNQATFNDFHCKFTFLSIPNLLCAFLSLKLLFTIKFSHGFVSLDIALPVHPYKKNPDIFTESFCHSKKNKIQKNMKNMAQKVSLRVIICNNLLMSLTPNSSITEGKIDFFPSQLQFQGYKLQVITWIVDCSAQFFWCFVCSSDSGILLVLFFTQFWQNQCRKKLIVKSELKRVKEEKSKGRFIVLLIQLSSIFVYTSHLVLEVSSFYGYYLLYILTFMSFIVVYLPVFERKCYYLKSILNLCVMLYNEFYKFVPCEIFARVEMTYEKVDELIFVKSILFLQEFLVYFC